MVRVEVLVIVVSAKIEVSPPCSVREDISKLIRLVQELIQKMLSMVHIHHSGR